MPLNANQIRLTSRVGVMTFFHMRVPLAGVCFVRVSIRPGVDEKDLVSMRPGVATENIRPLLLVIIAARTVHEQAREWWQTSGLPVSCVRHLSAGRRFVAPGELIFSTIQRDRVNKPAIQVPPANRSRTIALARTQQIGRTIVPSYAPNLSHAPDGNEQLGRAALGQHKAVPRWKHFFHALGHRPMACLSRV